MTGLSRLSECYDSADFRSLERSSTEIISGDLSVRDGDTRTGSEDAQRLPLFKTIVGLVCPGDPR